MCKMCLNTSANGSQHLNNGLNTPKFGLNKPQKLVSTGGVETHFGVLRPKQRVSTRAISVVKIGKTNQDALRAQSGTLNTMFFQFTGR